MTAVDPRAFFDAGEPVHQVRVRGVVRLATGARSRGERAADAMLLPATRLGARARRAAFSAAMWLGSGAATGTGDPAMRERIARVEATVPGCERHVALAGTPGPESKATLALLDGAGAALAWAKCAKGEVPRALVANEELLLGAVGGGLGPTLLSSGEDSEYRWVVVEALSGRPVRPGTRAPRVLLGRTLPGSGVTFAEHPAVESLRPLHPELIGDAETGAADRAFHVAPVHGDAAPWNAVAADDGTVRLFDWEYGRLDGIPETDAAHWSLQTDRLIAGMRPSEAVPRAVRGLASEGGLAVRQSAGVCVVTALVVADRQRSLGSQDQADWWLEAARLAAATATGGGS